MSKTTKAFKFKFTEIEQHKEKLNKISGLYCWSKMPKQQLLYVGKAEDLWVRINQYLRRHREKCQTGGYVNKEIVKLMEHETDDIFIVFIPMDSDGLLESERLFIQEHLPLFNLNENPRNVTASMQRIIGNIVTKSNKQWEHNELKLFIYDKYDSRLSIEQIEKGLIDKNRHLSKYGVVKSSIKNIKIYKAKTGRSTVSLHSSL